jgi:unsaturated rhamnogalacturonyl hydrolase
MKQVFTYLFLIVSSFVFGQTSPNSTWSVKFSNAMVARYQPNINNLTSKGWEYSNTIITHGMEKVYNQVTDSTKYLNYIQTYVDAYVNSSGVISATVNSLDRTHPGISLLFLYEKTGATKYRTAAQTLRNMYVGASATYPKTATGGIFWHKNNGSYNNIILIDGIYMLHPFLAKYGSLFSDAAAIDTAVNQTLYIYNQLYDPTTKLINHAWNSTKTETWANATTGNSPSVWSRGMGWFCMALVDIMKYVPSGHSKRAQLITAISNLAQGIQTYQDATTGMWYQVVDKGSSLSGNYLETTGSAMFVYMLKVASDSGWISNSYNTVATKAWNYMKNTSNGVIDIYSDTYPRINDFAPAMSVQSSDANYVQASLQGVSTPGTTHPHGYGAILMAASVMEFPLSSSLPIHFVSFTAQQKSGSVKLSWENGDDSQVEYYEIQRSNNAIKFETIGSLPSNKGSVYQFVDANPLKGTVYYRIKTIGLVEKEVYSNTISIRANSARTGGLTVYPNPIQNGQLQFVWSPEAEGTYQIVLINALGLAVKQEWVSGAEGVKSELWDVSRLAKGVYFLTVRKNDSIIDRKTVIISR